MYYIYSMDKPFGSSKLIAEFSDYELVLDYINKWIRTYDYYKYKEVNKSKVSKYKIGDKYTIEYGDKHLLFIIKR